MAGHVSHKLKNAFEGALAGGGDPATSPLYVFGPFLKLIVVAGVANVTFGASIWMVLITIAVVSSMYRLVMRWITDGSGGSGLSEEEFGSWAVKINAAITFIEYTLTFLVSMAAMVTFIADRVPILNDKILWVQYRTIIAILLSILVGWLVNRGPKMAARTFGPATAGVLVLLWAMVFATIARFGIQLPTINLDAFKPEFINFTIGGYVRILAVMTGIEVFANLVAAYEGDAEKKSRLSFNSLLIIMGTTGVTMLIVGPAIFNLADPTNVHVSVFTQTMDILLPAPFPLIGTFIGALVLMSASAASAQGLQNLALGLKERRYIPPVLGTQNEFEVADKPVWIEVAIVCVCFLAFGTHEETYLAIYAAGVFILLSMTGWAVTKRLTRQVKEQFSAGKVGLIIGSILASLLTTAATVIIFQERFLDGAWTYLLFIPMLYAFFSYFRSRLGDPSEAKEYLGRFNAAQLAGFGFGQAVGTGSINGNGNGDLVDEISWQPEPIEKSKWREKNIGIHKVAVLLDGSKYAAQALPYAKAVIKATGAQLTLLGSVKNHTPSFEAEFDAASERRMTYFNGIAEELKAEGIEAAKVIRPGLLADATKAEVDANNIDLVVTATRGKSGSKHWLSGGVSSKLMSKVTTPVLLVQVEEGEFDTKEPKMKRIMVALDGSILSERVLPYVRALAKSFNSEVILMTVPDVPKLANYRAPVAAVQAIRTQAIDTIDNFLDAIADSMREDGLKVETIASGTVPVPTIVKTADTKKTEMIMMTSQGRGGLDLLLTGSV
ncbi:MAG: universal stress protein, partial [Chloroflexota bacterium]